MDDPLALACSPAVRSVPLVGTSGLQDTVRVPRAPAGVKRSPDPPRRPTTQTRQGRRVGPPGPPPTLAPPRVDPGLYPGWQVQGLALKVDHPPLVRVGWQLRLRAKTARYEASGGAGDDFGRPRRFESTTRALRRQASPGDFTWRLHLQLRGSLANAATSATERLTAIVSSRNGHCAGGA